MGLGTRLGVRVSFRGLVAVDGAQGMYKEMFADAWPGRRDTVVARALVEHRTRAKGAVKTAQNETCWQNSVTRLAC